MTVTFVTQDKTSGVRSSEHSLSEKSVTRTHSLTFRVETDNPDDGSHSILLSPAVKHILDAHPEDFAARVIKVKANQRGENAQIWSLQVDYSTDSGSKNEFGDNDDPILEEREISWSGTSVSVVADKDRNGKAIVNSAGDPFDPAIEIERPHATLTVSQNQVSFSGSLAVRFIQKLNTSRFAGGEPGTVLCVNISADSKEKRGFRFWRVSYEFEFAPEGWQPEILQQGLRQLVNNKPEKCKDEDGDVSTPVLLDSAGAQMPPGAPAVFKTFDVYDEVDFNSLGLNV